LNRKRSFLLPVVWRRLVIFLLSLLPFLWLVFRLLTQQLGADPAKTMVLFTGEWTIYFLFISLAVTPLRRLLGWNWLGIHRRMLGLFALYYALLHLASYLIFILGLDFSRFFAEMIKRPYITVGLPAFLILLVLGFTSTQSMIRRLGKNWIKLHRLIYLALLLAWVHVLWQVRSSYFEAAVYAAITAFLLGIRIFWMLRKRMANRAIR